MSGILINNTSETPQYSLGDHIEFIFKPDESTLPLLGETVNVSIVDVSGAILQVIPATKLGDIYIAEYTIPLSLKNVYNTTLFDDSALDATLFYLSDSWEIDQVTSISFDFTVLRALEAVDEKNCIIEVFVDNVQAADGSVSSKSAIAFTSKLYPFYTTPEEVKSVNPNLLAEISSFGIARQIIDNSKYVDYMMKPSVIHYEDIYNNAVRNYTKLSTAIQLMLSQKQILKEEKMIDTFRYSVDTESPRAIISALEKDLYKHSLFILAGGKDTPYAAQTFSKGLFDSNRINAARGRYNNNYSYPYLNTSSKATIVNVNGQNIEIRGERTIGYGYMINNVLQDISDTGISSGI